MITEGTVLDVVLDRNGLRTIKQITVELPDGKRAGVAISEEYGKSHQITRGDKLAWDSMYVRWTPAHTAAQSRKDVLLDRYHTPVTPQRKTSTHKRVLAGAK